MAHWEERGIVDRETALYRRLRPYLASLCIVTSGGEQELGYQKTLDACGILHNRWKLPPNLYTIAAPFLHRKRLRDVTLFRTHQLDGAWSAAIASRVYARPLIVRAGYLWAEFFERERGWGIKARIASALQSFALRQAEVVVLTTDEMKHHVMRVYGIAAESIHVIPNYVDVGLFRPRPDVEPVAGRVCYIGRLHARKNVIALLRALTRVPGASLTVVGEGGELATLLAFARERRIEVRFLGALPQERLPEEIARAEVFVLPSRFEGHPKALIEAMACGAAVVGTDVEGTRAVIRHEETGLLCPLTEEGLARAIQRLLADGDLRRRLGRAARAFVEREYGLDRIVEQELALLARTGQRRYQHAAP
jgi:glycosyltransferase involved in cell wall biosynthesis